MSAIPDGCLHVYMLNVGQADTTVTVTPKGNVIVIDACNPTKILNLLKDLGMTNNTIEHLVITHPHSDHFRGGNRLARDLKISEATIGPFWHEFGMGPPTYRRLVGRLNDQKTNVHFLAGYSRQYPDGAMKDPLYGQGSYPVIDDDALFLELLGPTNGLVRMLEDANVFDANHLSIMSRLSWRNFRMINTGDAQMENWSFFDHERMLEDKCQVLRAAHHGSANGTQWERISRLNPSTVVVSSDPGTGHHLPGVTSTAIFAKYDSEEGKMAALTSYTGTIHLRVTAGGARTFEYFVDKPGDNVDLANGTALTETSNPTDWAALLDKRVKAL